MYSKANNLMDSIMEIYSQLGGYNEMVKSIEDILSNKIEDIDDTIKSAIKTSLKETISCGIEPTIGDMLINTGITFDIKRIDPLSIFNIDPESENGSYAYYDNNSGLDSTDFNVFLYSVIKESIDNPNYHGATWTKRITNSTPIPIFTVSFKEFDELTQKSNQLKINLHESFRGYKLSFFISEYLDSIKLFNNVQVISHIFDDILNSRIISSNKTNKQISLEKTVSNLVDKMFNDVDDIDDVIDDSFYKFSNDTYNQMIEDVENKKRGLFSYGDVSSQKISTNQELLLDSLNELKTDGLLVSQQTKILTDTIDSVANDLADRGSVSNKQKYSFKVDLIRGIIKKMMVSITTFIFTPKITFLFSMTSKLYGLNDSDDIVGLIKDNINIYKLIIVKIRGMIMQMFIDKIKEMVSPLIATVSIELVKEKFSIYRKQVNDIRNAIENSVNTIRGLSGKQ